jgi:hypothetical protein
MRDITLVRVPGTGASRISVTDTMTVEDLVSSQDLHGRSIIINGVGVTPDAYKTTTLEGAVEIFAAAAVKGA